MIGNLMLQTQKFVFVQTINIVAIRLLNKQWIVEMINGETYPIDEPYLPELKKFLSRELPKQIECSPLT